MPLRIVQSKQNSRLKQLRRALAQPLHEAGDDGRVLVGIEGPNLVGEALRAGIRIACVFVAAGAEKLLDLIPLEPHTEMLLLPKSLLDSVLTTEAPQAIAALVEAPDWSWDDLLDCSKGKAALIVVLAGLQDPGNMGTILRSAEAFGASGAVSLPGTVSAWNPKAVRASAGSVFRLPLLAVGADECFQQLRAAKVRILTAATQGADPVQSARLAEAVAFLIGNEGNGVAREIAAQANGAITIPCPGQVESLNAGVAASVLLYEASRQRGGLR